MEFKRSPAPSIGVELELQLLRAGTLDLHEGILPLIELYPNSPYIKPELIQYTVEVSTPVCRGCDELTDRLRRLIGGLQGRCHALGMRLCGAGTHPFCERLAPITPTPRYRAIEAECGYLTHTQIVFATHVHVGMGSGAEAIRAMQVLRPYLPVLLALAANSPFYHGFDTGFACYRHRILAATRSYGLPPPFARWEEFVRFFTVARRSGMFAGLRDIHWDVRPRPDYGTLEVRVMDAQPTIQDTVALAALVFALVERIKETGADEPGGGVLPPVPYWVEKENRYRASRDGLDARFIVNGEGATRPLREVAADTLAWLHPVIGRHALSSQMALLSQRLRDGPGYARQREAYRRTGSLQQVVAALVKELEEELRPRARINSE